MGRRCAALLLLSAALVGCRSALPPEALTVTELAAAVGELRAPLPPQMAALYRLRVRATGGLRMAVVAGPEGGRISVSEPFGALVSVTGWQGHAAPTTVDLRADCRVDGRGLAATLGFELLPVPELLALLGGRLPAVGDDRVALSEDGTIEIAGQGWRVSAELAAAPWRVVAVHDEARDAVPRWTMQLGDHSASVPGSVRFVHADGRWAELELVRLEWQHAGDLAPLPERPPCAGAGAEEAP